MATSADQFTFDESIEMDKHPYLFESKQYIFQPDSQAGSYGTPQISFDTNLFSSQDRFLDIKQVFITVPLILALNTTAFLGTAINSNAFALSLKNGYHQLINSMTCQISNGDFITQSSHSNMKINYDITTSFSKETETSFGFSGIDDWKSFEYAPTGTATTKGLGEINNSLVPSAFVSTGGYLATGVSNQTRLKRMLDNTSYDPASATSSASAFFSGS